MHFINTFSPENETRMASGSAPGIIGRYIKDDVSRIIFRPELYPVALPRIDYNGHAHDLRIKFHGGIEIRDRY